MKFKELLNESSFVIKALVTDKETKKKRFVEETYEANNITDAIKMMKHDLIKNGYSLVQDHIKEKSVFDFIIDNTDCSSYDWKYINKVFKNSDEAREFVNKKIFR